MAIFGELTYLLFYGETMFVRVFMVSAVCFGFFIHLLLDEIYSVEWDGRPRIKRSFGTAMKFVGENWWANATCYAKLIVLTYFVLVDPSVVHQLSSGQSPAFAQNLGQTMKEKIDQASASLNAKNSGAPPKLASLFNKKSTAPTNDAKPAANLQLTNSPTVAAPAASWAGSPAPASSAPASQGPAVVPSGYTPAAPAANNFYTPVNNRSAAAAAERP